MSSNFILFIFILKNIYFFKKKKMGNPLGSMQQTVTLSTIKDRFVQFLLRSSSIICNASICSSSLIPWFQSPNSGPPILMSLKRASFLQPLLPSQLNHHHPVGVRAMAYAFLPDSNVGILSGSWGWFRPPPLSQGGGQATPNFFFFKYIYIFLILFLKKLHNTW